jgi:hypothetical protein
MNETFTIPESVLSKIEYNAFKIVEMQMACQYLSHKSFAKQMKTCSFFT